MIKGTVWWKRVCAVLAKIHIVDKFLIIFMLLLMFQSTHNLFANHTATGESAHIDVIVRSSTAAIFGYFLSTNFMRHTSNRSKNKVDSNSKSYTKDAPTVSDGVIQNRIGFEAHDSDNTLRVTEIGNTDSEINQSSNESSVSKLQIIVTSIIGLFCLAVLIIARDISALNTDMTASITATATATQFRDFVSGCIGFLIGCPTTNLIK